MGIPAAAILGSNWLATNAGICAESSGITPSASGTRLLTVAWSAALRYVPLVAFAICRSTSPWLCRRLVRNEFSNVAVVIWIPTSNVTPNVTARIALRFFVFLLERDRHAIIKLDLVPIISPNKGFGVMTPNERAKFCVFPRFFGRFFRVFPSTRLELGLFPRRLFGIGHRDCGGWP